MNDIDKTSFISFRNSLFFFEIHKEKENPETFSFLSLKYNN